MYKDLIVPSLPISFVCRTEVLGGSPRLVLGVYTVTPALGLIPAGQSQTITVDCLTGDKPGRHEEVDIESIWASCSVALTLGKLQCSTNIGQAAV